MKSYEAQVHGVGDPWDSWTGNSMRFATEEEAKTYLAELGSRWFGFDRSRVVETDDPVTYAIVGGVARASRIAGHVCRSCLKGIEDTAAGGLCDDCEERHDEARTELQHMRSLGADLDNPESELQR